MNTDTGEIRLYNDEQMLEAISSGMSLKEIDIHKLKQHKKAELIHSGVTKIGRNYPCACGSGKKFKKCCMT